MDQWQLYISAALVALIWLVQLLIYPAFRFVDEQNWKAYHEHHTSRISWVVVPLMLAELGISILAFCNLSNWSNGIILSLILMIWAITFIGAVPVHNQLRNQKDLKLITTLIRINWSRTILWSAKFLILIPVNF